MCRLPFLSRIGNSRRAVARTVMGLCALSCLLGVAACSPDGAGEGDRKPWLRNQGDAAVDADASETRGDGDVSDVEVSPPPSDGDGADVREADGRGERDGSGSDLGGDTACADFDADGLTNCEEAEMCTDPEDGDTDGDGLTDLEEVQRRTDPCDEDTDGDGLDDREEVEYDLDPKDGSTYDDGVQDGERWFVDACEQVDSEEVEMYEEAAGNWKAAFRPAVEYTPLEVSGVDAPEAAAVFAAPDTAIAGAIVSKEAGASDTSPIDELTGPVSQAIGDAATVDSEAIGQEFESFDDKPAAIASYELSLDEPSTFRELRNELLVAVAPFERSAVDGELPGPDGESATSFRLRIVGKFRKHRDGEVTQLLEFALVPRGRYENEAEVPYRLEGMATTTNLADGISGRRTECLSVQGTAQDRGPFEFVGSPILASTRMYVDDEWVPWSRQDGWDYREAESELLFFGDARLGNLAVQQGHTVWAVAGFESFWRRCHTGSYSPSNTCQAP